MKQGLSVIAMLAVMGLSAVAGFVFHQSRLQGETHTLETTFPDDKTIVGQRRPDFQLPDLEGEHRDINEWDGKLLVLNFWATWCPPCREEIPEFISLQTEFAEQDVQFLGIALETAEDVLPFYQELAVNYPSLVGQQAVINVAKQYGNQLGALPYTVIIDKSGIVRSTQRGPLSLKEARARILSYL